jgi:hypothetical protein
MQAIERILEIEAAFGEKIQGLVPLELDGESLRLILIFERRHELAGHRTME